MYPGAVYLDQLHGAHLCILRHGEQLFFYWSKAMCLDQLPGAQLCILTSSMESCCVHWSAAVYLDQLPGAQLLILIAWQQSNMVYFLRVQSVHFCDRELFVRVVIISHSTLCISSPPVHLVPSPTPAPALSSDPIPCTFLLTFAYTVRSACKLRARRTEYKSVFFQNNINCWRKIGAYLA